MSEALRCPCCGLLVRKVGEGAVKLFEPVPDPRIAAGERLALVLTGIPYGGRPDWTRVRDALAWWERAVRDVNMKQAARPDAGGEEHRA